MHNDFSSYVESSLSLNGAKSYTWSESQINFLIRGDMKHIITPAKYGYKATLISLY